MQDDCTQHKPGLQICPCTSLPLTYPIPSYSPHFTSQCTISSEPSNKTLSLYSSFFILVVNCSTNKHDRVCSVTTFLWRQRVSSERTNIFSTKMYFSNCSTLSHQTHVIATYIPTGWPPWTKPLKISPQCDTRWSSKFVASSTRTPSVQPADHQVRRSSNSTSATTVSTQWVQLKSPAPRRWPAEGPAHTRCGHCPAKWRTWWTRSAAGATPVDMPTWGWRVGIRSLCVVRAGRTLTGYWPSV